MMTIGSLPKPSHLADEQDGNAIQAQLEALDAIDQMIEAQRAKLTGQDEGEEPKDDAAALEVEVKPELDAAGTDEPMPPKKTSTRMLFDKLSRGA